MYHEPAGTDTAGGFAKVGLTKPYGLVAGQRNFGRVVTEKACMQALLRAEDGEPDDEQQPEGDSSAQAYRPTPKPILRMRCYACAGSGKIRVTDSSSLAGRQARCVACRGTGRVEVK